MYEVEVKVPADLSRVRRRVADLEAEAVGSVLQVDTYYDAPHRSFPETDEALRVRLERHEGDEMTRLTYKGPLVDDRSKTREEVETAVADADAIDGILTNLGFSPAATVRKNRERFRLGEYTVSLDAVEEVGEYVEVETTVAKAPNVETARDEAFAVLERLGLDPDEQIRMSYLELSLEE